MYLNGDRKMSVTLAMWEFGQNDAKRDSGSKLCRLGYSVNIRIGASFPGVVLSSEATQFVSPADKEIIETHGIAGINCSWNRLEEIPFDKMGKGTTCHAVTSVMSLMSVMSVMYDVPFVRIPTHSPWPPFPFPPTCQAGTNACFRFCSQPTASITVSRIR